MTDRIKLLSQTEEEYFDQIFPIELRVAAKNWKEKSATEINRLPWMPDRKLYFDAEEIYKKRPYGPWDPFIGQRPGQSTVRREIKGQTGRIYSQEEIRLGNDQALLEKNKNDPQWLYHNWCYWDWPLSAQRWWIAEWERSKSFSGNQQTLFQFLIKDEYGSEWYYINNWLSQDPTYPTLPNPDDELYKTFELDKLHRFYRVLVPEAATIVKWYFQFPLDKLGLDRKTQLWTRCYLRAPEKWFSITVKKVENKIDENKNALIGTSLVVVVGILGAAVIVSYKK